MLERPLPQSNRPATASQPDAKAAYRPIDARAWDPVEIWRNRVLAAGRPDETATGPSQS
jgi:hypothetical protein